eukprot:comp20153_c0_seq1/m.24925 comp20153_c0_seq1/g.24925  ORF comp20153_c0_seq1/g.24925 comp20153_c0_seq1/m.24925 type:complete len:381 (-) comp20153_c0_seq1:10-1152(-)
MGPRQRKPPTPSPAGTQTEIQKRKGQKGSGWLLWVLLVVAVAAGAYLALGGGVQSEDATAPAKAKKEPKKRTGHVRVLGNNFVGEGLRPFAQHVFGDVTDLNVTVLSHWDNIPATDYKGAYVFLDGETWGLPDRFLGQSKRIVYVGPDGGAKGDSLLVPVPFASMFFMEADPLKITSVLQPRTANTDKREHFAAYLYFRCHPHREQFFSALSTAANQEGVGSVHALGTCTGGTGKRTQHRHGSRQHPNYHAEGVKIYGDYLFTISFENTKSKGYVTEKIVTAFLSGAIPIYWGDEGVKDIFNPETFVYVSGPEDYDRAIKEVMAIARDKERQKRMRTAPLLAPGAAEKFFTWHRDVRKALKNSSLKDRLVEAARTVAARP